MIFTEDAYKEYLRATAKLSYNFINKFLIHFQNRGVTDVRSEIDWLAVDRAVSKVNNPIYIIEPVNKSCYIDATTGKEVETDGLGFDDLSKALKLGIIKREKENIGFTSAIVYDIKDTESDGINMAEPEHKIKISEMCAICIKLDSKLVVDTNARTSMYNEKENKLSIGSDSTINKAEAAIRCFSTLLIKQKARSMLDKSKADIQAIEQLAFESVVVTVAAYYNIDIKSDLSCVNKLCEHGDMTEDVMHRLVGIMDFVEDCRETALKLLDVGYSNRKMYAQSKIDKAEKLLNILEAHETFLKLKRSKIVPTNNK